MSSVTGVKRAYGPQISLQSDSDSEIYKGASLNPMVDAMDRTKLKELRSNASGVIQVKLILSLPASCRELVLQNRAIFRIANDP